VRQRDRERERERGGGGLRERLVNASRKAADYLVTLQVPERKRERETANEREREREGGGERESERERDPPGGPTYSRSIELTVVGWSTNIRSPPFLCKVSPYLCRVSPFL
jgi:hypothetical protein